MIHTVRDACHFSLMGLLLPSFGAAYLLQSLIPLWCWLIACALLVFTEPKR